MKHATYQPPKRFCGAEINQAFETVEAFYIFNKETGTYENNDLADDVRIICPMCRADVKELFPEGIGNYQSPEPEKK